MRKTIVLVIFLLSCHYTHKNFEERYHFKAVKTKKFQYNPKELRETERLSYGKWWENRKYKGEQNDYSQELAFEKIPRDKVIAFALYAINNSTLKISAQFYPLFNNEERSVYLDFYINERWQEVARETIPELGWSASFRIENWSFKKNVAYRLRHPGGSTLKGTIKVDPIHKDEIVLASLSCIHHRGKKYQQRVRDIVALLKKQKPDLLFFAGDQTYFHTEHTAGWILFGTYFRDILKDCPSVIIPDDHDVGQYNIWGTAGKLKAKSKRGSDWGGFHKSTSYVNMVQRAQTSHLPDPYDPTPLKNGISVYYTNLNLGGIGFAILEDRKWKSAPVEVRGKKVKGRIDYITDPNFDVTSIDKASLNLLGKRQEDFLKKWTENWQGVEMKAILSQSPLAALAHKHGGNKEKNRLRADLDSNGWPQNKRKKALRLFRRALAPHISGDQHLMTLSQHGIDNWNDGVWSFVSPAMGYGVYQRNWHPLKKEKNYNIKNLNFTGEYYDGFDNKISVYSYANQGGNEAISKGLGHSIIRFNKRKREITFEAYPRFQNITQPIKQFPGLPKTIRQWDNDGRKIQGYLPKVKVEGLSKPILQVINETNNEILYTFRLKENSFLPPIYDKKSNYTIKVGKDFPQKKKKNIKVDITGKKEILFKLEDFTEK